MTQFIDTLVGIFQSSGFAQFGQPGGWLYAVVRKQQGAPSALKYLKELYAEAETIERDGGYWVIACRK